MRDNLALPQFVGQTIKTFLLEELLAQNAMGATYLARSTVSRQTCRLQVFLLPQTISPEERIVLLGYFQHYTRELHEALTHHEVQPRHPHLLPLLDAGSYQDVLYLVTPFLATRTLATLLEAQGPLDAQTVGRYLDEMASALEYAHEHALLHGDLTGASVFLPPDGRCVMADLGVRSILERIWSGQPPTFFYASRQNSAPAPEQVRGQTAQASTDVYALGALVYQLLTGQPLFLAESPQSALAQHLRAPVPSLASRRRVLVGRADVTADLDRLLAAALAKEPLQRIQHPAHLANAYHQIVAPHDRSRAPVYSPLAEKVATPLAGPDAGEEGTRAEQYARKSEARVVEARRRAMLFLGGGAVTVGALAYVASQLLRGRGSSRFSSSTSFSTTSGTGSGQATGASASTGASAGGQATTTAGGASSAGNVIAKTSAVPLNSAITFTNPNPNSSQPGVLVHLANGQFVAFDSTCTHFSSCGVQYVSQDKLLECPCHGAEFDPANHASVVQGPAGTPLAPIAITVHADGTITAG